jgi:hypothetical protein
MRQYTLPNHLPPNFYESLLRPNGIPFADKMAALTTTLKQQIDKEAELNQEIEKQLSKIGFAVASINKISLLWLVFSRRKNQRQAGIPVL